ncbi:MAG: hypothetical protein GWP47_00940 [Actinobacteria bacterium]|nr:hypothetical protein [Actinomycetota bacterium]
MASAPVDELRSRAVALGIGDAIDVMSTPGGGTLPGIEIPSAGVAINGDRRVALRERERPLIGRMIDGRTVIDMRTVHPDDDGEVAEALASL